MEAPSIFPRLEHRSSTTSSSSISHHSPTSTTPKLPISRLPGKDYEIEPRRPKARVDRACGVACTRCRRRKVKCDGARPTCKCCQLNQAPCEYQTSRRDRLKELTDQNSRLKKFLKDFGMRAENGRQKRDIEEFLEKLEQEEANPNNISPPPLVNDTLPPVQQHPRKATDAAEKLPSINCVMADVSRYYDPISSKPD